MRAVNSRFVAIGSRLHGSYTLKKRGCELRAVFRYHRSRQLIRTDGQNMSQPAATTNVDPARTASNRRIRYGWFFGLALIGCVADLLTKHYVFQWLGIPSGQLNIHWLAEGYIGIETALNEGAVFGIGQKKVWFFASMSFFALGGVGYWLVKHHAIDDWVLATTLGLVTGGILGNLYDRLGLWSNFEIFAVRDWIRFSYNYDQFIWPNFNIADCLLVCGAGLLFFHSLKNPDSSPAADTPK